MRLLLLLLVLALTLEAQRTIDLKPYGFRGTSNRDFVPREFANEVAYLPDGSLVVAFRSHALVSGRMPARVRHMQPTEMIRVDSHGTLLARTRAFVSPDVPFLAAAPEGVAVIEGDALVLYTAELKEDKRFEFTREMYQAELIPEVGAFVIYERLKDGKAEASVLDLRTLTVRSRYTVPFSSHLAPLGEGYAVVGHDIHENRVVKIFTGDGGRAEGKHVLLPMLPCRTMLKTISAHDIIATTCGEWMVFDENGSVKLKGHLRADEDSPTITAAGARLTLTTFVGFAGYPRDEQREHADKLRVAVYDISSGGKLFFRDLPMPRLGGSVALRRDGKEVAVLKDGEVELINLP